MRYLVEKASIFLSNSVARSIVVVFQLRLFGLLLEYSLTFALIHQLSMSDFGIYSLIYIIIVALSNLSTLGLDYTLTKSLAYYKKKCMFPLYVGVIEATFVISLVVGIFFSVVCMFFSPVVFNLNGISCEKSLKIIYLLIPIFAFFKVKQVLMFYFARPVFAEIFELIIRPVVLIAIIFIININNLNDYFRVLIIVNVVGFSSMFFLMIPRHFEIRLENQPIYNSLNWVKASLPLLSANFLQLFIGYTDIFMISAMLSVNSVASYAVAAKFAALITIFMSTLNTVALPKLSELYFSKDKVKLQFILKIISRFSALVSVLLIFGMYVIYQYSTNILTDDYIDAYAPMLILAISHALVVCMGSCGIMLNLYDEQKLIFKFALISAVVNAAFNFFLIQIYGVSGAAISTGISTLCYNIMLFIRVYCRHGLNPAIV